MKLRFQTSRRRTRSLQLGLIVAFAAVSLRADDWPQYRGPNHDGQSAETIRTNWSQEPPQQIWKVPLEPAYSSFAMAGGKAYTQVRRAVAGQDKEFCIALNADTGAELWATLLSNDDAVYDFGESLTDDGPRSTPTLDGNRVFVLTSYLKIFCLNATNGQEIWSKDLAAEYGGQNIDWQSAASPLIDGELIFINCNGPNQRLLALWKNDGSEAWKGQDDKMTQATPVAATIAGVRQIVFFTQSGLVSVVPTNGAVLWRYPFSYSTSTAASPVVAGDVVYCSAAYGVGSGAVRITASADQLTTNEVWRLRGDNMNHWATPVHHNGFLYGIFGQSVTTLRCIDLATGTRRWPQDIRDPQVSFGRGGVLLVNEKVLVLSESGALVLVEPNPTNYIEIARFQALDGSHSSQTGLAVRCWNVPAISNGRIYVRSTTEAVCLDVAVASPPTNRPPLAPTNLSPPDGAADQLLTLTLQASAFSDPDADGHALSRWVIKRIPDDTTAFDSGNDSVNKTSLTVPAGILSSATTYSWSVSYTDSRGAQGPASAPTSFATQPLAPLKLFSTLTSGPGVFQLLIGSGDGTSLDTNRAANIDVFASTDLTLGLNGWIKLNSLLTLTNGQLSLDDPQSPTTPQRFFRVKERP